MAMQVDAAGAIFAVLEGAITNYASGLPFDVNGRLVVSTDPPARFDQGMGFNATGAVCVDSGAITRHDQGVGFSAGGGMSSGSIVQGDPFNLTIGFSAPANFYGFTGIEGAIDPATWTGSIESAVIQNIGHDADVAGELDITFIGNLQPAIAINWYIGGEVALMTWSVNHYVGNSAAIAAYLIANNGLTVPMGLEIAEPSLLTPIPTIFGTVDAAIAPYDVTQNFKNADTYVLVGGPAWMSLVNNLLIGEPLDDTDTAGITVEATNVHGTTPSNNFATDVSYAPPVFSGTVPSPTWEVGVAIPGYDASQHFTTGGQGITYSLSVPIPGIAISSTTGAISGTPTDVNVLATRVVATNSGGVAQSNLVTVSVVGVLAPPIFDGNIADFLVETGVNMNYNAAARFTTGGVVDQYTLQNNPAWMSINGSGVISGVPPSDATVVGVTVTGANTSGNDVSNAFEVETLSAPVFTGPIDDKEGEVDVPLAGYDMSTHYVNGGAVTTYAANRLPVGVVIDPNTGIISGTPTQIGTTLVTVTGTNVFGSSPSNPVSLSVIAAAPDAPVFDGVIPNLTSNVGAPMQTYNAAQHFTTGGVPDTYTLQNAPAWMDIDESGNITGTPDVEAVTAGITVTAINATGNSVSNGFSMDAQAAQVGRNVLRFTKNSYGVFPTLVNSNVWRISATITLYSSQGNTYFLVDTPTGDSVRFVFGSGGGGFYQLGGGGANTSFPDGTITLGVEADIVWESDGIDVTITVDDVEIIRNPLVGTIGISCVSHVDTLATNIGFDGIVKDLSIVTEHVDYFWALDSGSVVSEDSTNDPATMVFFNVVAGDWSVET